MGIPGTHFVDRRRPGGLLKRVDARTIWIGGSIKFSPLKDPFTLLDLPDPILPPRRRQPPLPVIGQEIEHPPKADSAYKVSECLQVVEHNTSFEDTSEYCGRRLDVASLTHQNHLKHESYDYAPTKLTVSLYIWKL